MSEQLQKYTPNAPSKVGGSIEINTIDDVARVSQMMARSGFFEDARNAAQAGVKILAGMELDIPPMAAMRGIHVMEGNTTLSGPMLAALIKRHPRYDYKAVESTDTRAEIAFFEDGEQVGTASFTWEEAKQIGLTRKNNWKNYASDMLFWRALTRGQRRYAPDVGMGAVYTPDELGAETDADGNVVDAKWTDASGDGAPNASSESDTPDPNDDFGIGEPTDPEDVADATSEPALEERVEKARQYMAKAMKATPQAHREAIDTVRERAEEALEGDEAERMNAQTIPFEAIGHIRGAVQGDHEAIDEEAFNRALSWFVQQLEEHMPDEDIEWAHGLVEGEVHRLVDQVPGFEVTVEEDEAPEADRTIQAMQNGESALGGNGRAEDQPQPEAPDERRYNDHTDAINQLFDKALQFTNSPDPDEDDRISEKQLKRMCAIASEHGWKDSWLDRLVKDELGFESKSHVPYGFAYDEICAALEDQELKFWMSRDPDTKDLFAPDA